MIPKWVYDKKKVYRETLQHRRLQQQVLATSTCNEEEILWLTTLYVLPMFQNVLPFELQSIVLGYLHGNIPNIALIDVFDNRQSYQTMEQVLLTQIFNHVEENTKIRFISLLRNAVSCKKPNDFSSTYLSSFGQKLGCSFSMACCGKVNLFACLIIYIICVSLSAYSTTLILRTHYGMIAHDTLLIGIPVDTLITVNKQYWQVQTLFKKSGGTNVYCRMRHGDYTTYINAQKMLARVKLNNTKEYSLIMNKSETCHEISRIGYDLITLMGKVALISALLGLAILAFFVSLLAIYPNLPSGFLCSLSDLMDRRNANHSQLFY